MPVIGDFTLARYEDGVLTIGITPPTNIGGWEIQFSVSKRMGGTSLLTKSASSGYSNVSGIQITDSGQGRFKVFINSPNTSGLDYGNYAYICERLTSGSRTVLAEGYLILTP